jgi:hypothetical protein
MFFKSLFAIKKLVATLLRAGEKHRLKGGWAEERSLKFIIKGDLKYYSY